jgi:hypothetical protein
MIRSASRPGLAKTKRPPVVNQRSFRLIASSDARWGELFENADVVSEGAPRGEGSERAYFGSSDIILLVRPERAYETLEQVARVAATDPHVKLRAVRTARREAAQRARGPIDRLRAEVTVSACERGVAVHVEVEANVLPERRARPRGEQDDTGKVSGGSNP